MFVLLVEGQTERNCIAEFLKRWLDPQLKQPVGIQVVKFEGYADLVRKMETKVRMHLEGPKRAEIVGVIGLLDLYGPTFFPPDKTSVEDRFQWGKNHFEQQIGSEKFRFFFAVHEFEAWLLSQPEIFPSDIRPAILPKSVHPERVNMNEPPAKLLNRIYYLKTRSNYKKTTHGKQLFPKLDPAVAVTKCPYLQMLLGEMLDMAKAAGL